MNIRSVTEYKKIIDDLNNKYASGEENRFLYRGHGNHNQYELLPGVFRRISKDKNSFIRPYNQDEKAILLEYKAGRPSAEIDNKTLSELAQHYRVPTRQFDFTEDPYVALYFACERPSQAGDFPSVWLFDRVNYTELFFENEKAVDCSWDSNSIVKKIIHDEIFDRVPGFHNDPEQYVMRPYIYKPEWSDLREVNQKSWFMIWGARQDPLDVIVNLNYNNTISLGGSAEFNSKQVLGVISIDPLFRETILGELFQMGYDQNMIYPTVDDHGVYVKNNNYNEKNSQYSEYRSGGATLILQAADPSKEKWNKRDD